METLRVSCATATSARAVLAALLLASCGAANDAPVPTSSRPRLGTFLFSASGPTGADQAAFRSALGAFDVYSLPVFFTLVQAKEGVFDFSLPDAVADAAPPGTMLYVNNLISNSFVPDWLKTSGYTGARLRDILTAFVTAAVTHFESKYPGRVMAYEVVLEPLSYHGASGLWNKIGLELGTDDNEYIRLALRAARAAAPRAKLYLDDFGVEDEGQKADALHTLVSDLVSGGTPLDGVAFEGHFMLGGEGSFPAPPPAGHVTKQLERYAALGLETMLSSVDIAIADDAVSSSTLAEQAQAYGDLIRACRAAGCVMFATWGLGDDDSWIPQYFPGWGSPLMFDAHYAPKPAFAAAQAALAE